MAHLRLKWNTTNKMLLHCCYTTVYSVTTQIEKMIKTFWYEHSSFCVSLHGIRTNAAPAVHAIRLPLY